MNRIGMRLAALAAALAGVASATVTMASPVLNWNTVVNNASVAPDANGERFFSYNQPSVNDAGLVVFRARARTPAGGGGGGGAGGEPVRGIFSRDMSTANAPVTTIASNTGSAGTVPGPNNLGASFTEFPSFPRIDARSDTVVFRGQSTPVLEYETGPGGETTRGGTSGVYTNPQGTLITGASLLGNVANPDLSHFQVPGAAAGTRFDQFPGAPTVTGDTVVFKGNWTDASGGHTGIYYRDVLANGGQSAVRVIAASGEQFDSNGQGSFATFGSTAPPSASDGRVVFTGLDNEEAPTAGGIFMSSLSDPLHTLTSLVRIGVTAVGNGIDAVFKTVGEALSFDGNKVGFWGSWGNDTKAVTVSCPTDGNASLLAACRSQDTNGTAGDGIYTFTVPANQGVFVVDTETGEITMQARTGDGFDDFLFWTFSGAPEDAGSGDTDGREDPRWRSSAFVAVDGGHTVFKGLADDELGVSGLYGNFGQGVFTILETGMDGGAVDAAAAGMAITSVGVERDGFRNGWLAINVGMANAEESWSGVYVAFIPEPGSLALTAMALAALGLARRRRPSCGSGGGMEQDGKSGR